MLYGPSGHCRLARAETRLLAALCAAKDQTLERWQVAQQLSSSGNEISADSLQNRLSQLRKKIEKCGAPSHSITAVRNFGYKLEVSLTVH